MKCMVSLAILLFAAAWCAAQGQQATTVTWAEVQGFSGRIHTQKVFRRELNKDPRPEKSKMWIRDAAPWQVFDEEGGLIATGNLDASAAPINVVLTRFSGDRHRRESTWPDGTTNTFEEDYGPFGVTETRIFLNGKMTSRNVLTYDEKGNEVAFKQFDGQGTIISHSVSHYTRETKETFSWDAHGEINHHTLSRYDEDGAEMERTDYDPLGKPYADFRVNKVELLSYWVDPACKCADGVAYSIPGDRTVFYLIDQDGRFQKSVEHHRGRRTNMEPDDGEQYDAAGRLLDRVVYAYERDAHGNWIRRIVSVLDPESRTMVPILEQTRILTYY